MSFDTHIEARSQKRLDPFAVAAGLMRNDLPILAPLFLALGVAGGVQTLYGASSFVEVFTLQIAERVIQLTVLLLVVLRWRGKLSKKDNTPLPVFPTVARIFTVGLLLWGALMSPTFLLLFARNANLALPISVLFVLGILWCFRFYFYFIAYGLLGSSLMSGLSQTLAIGRRDPMGSVRSLISPVAITSLLVWLVALPSPDGRSIGWATAGAAAQGLFWLLSVYTGLGLGLTLLDDQEWRNAKLDAYRKERLETLETQGRGSAVNLLSPSSGAKIFALAVCLMAVNIYQALHIKPAVVLTVVSWEAVDQKLKLSLRAEDDAYHFRGFNPIAFSVRSQTGYDISTELLRVSKSPPVDGQKGTFDIDFSGVVSSTPLFLEFATNKREDVLRGMDNMWLWYNKVPIAPLRVAPIAGGDRG